MTTHSDSVTHLIEHCSAIKDEEAVCETLRDIETLDKWLMDVPAEFVRRATGHKQKRA